MSQRGAWCGYQDSWMIANQDITYDKLLVNSSTIDLGVGYGLDIDTGNQTLIILNLVSVYFEGVFTVPQTGEWRVSFSMRSEVDSGQTNTVYIFQNYEIITESRDDTHSEWYDVMCTGGQSRETPWVFTQIQLITVWIL